MGADNGDDAANRNTKARETEASKETSNGRSKLDEKGTAVLTEDSEETLNLGGDVSEQLADAAGGLDDGAEGNTEAREAESRDKSGNLRAELDHQHLQVLAEDSQEAAGRRGGVFKDLASGTVTGNSGGNGRDGGNRRRRQGGDRRSGNGKVARATKATEKVQELANEGEVLQAGEDVRKLAQRQLLQGKAIQGWNTGGEREVLDDRQTLWESRGAAKSGKAADERNARSVSREVAQELGDLSDLGELGDLGELAKTRQLRKGAGGGGRGQSGGDGKDRDLHFGCKE